MYPTMEFRDQRIWITGASSGIGEALARAMAARGACLVLSARNREALEHVATACVAAGGPAPLVLPLDVTDYAAIPTAAAAAAERFGGIDMLINNAGISQRSFCIDTDFAVYRRLLEVDVLGQIALTQAVLPTMLEQGHGHIAATASVAGKVGAPLRTGYCAAKHAVMGFFDALRAEVAADGLRVTTIVPGFIRTNISSNALGGDGQATGETDEDIGAGMDPDACAEVIVEGFEAGTPEIEVGEGPEMQLLALKREDPEGAFRLLEAMTGQIRERLQGA
jgi:dehydrogenase/reductase SDR family protein 7